MSGSPDIRPDESRIPRHIAIIMDGNGRWASRRHLPRFAGHRAGVQVVENVVRYCGQCGTQVLTLFAFSSENWRRPSEEVGLLMGLFVNALEHQVKRLHDNNVRLRVIGDLSTFNSKLQRSISKAELLTEHNSGLKLNIAASYGGRWDLTEATRSVAKRVLHSELGIEEITPDLVGDSLALSDLPEPDLFIRTGGEQRISNFLLWQLAYAELYFTDVLWPDFDRKAFEQALASYASRQRRFGRTGAQVASALKS